MTLRLFVSRPVIHDHAIRAVWSASAAAVPNEVRGATIEPPTVRVVCFTVPVAVEVMLHAIAYRFIHIQVITQWHTASFDNPWCLVLTLASLVNEALGALSGSLITRFLLFQPLVFLGQLLWLLLVIIVTFLRLPVFLVLRSLWISVGWFLFLLLLLLFPVVSSLRTPALGLLLGGRHGELVPALLLCSLGVVPVTQVALSMIIIITASPCCRLFLFLVSLLLVILRGLLIGRFVLVFGGRFGCFRGRFTEPAGQIRFSCMSGGCCGGCCGGFHAVVGQRDGLDVGDEVAGCGGCFVIIVDTLAAADFSEAFLALEISVELFYCFPIHLVFIILIHALIVSRGLGVWHSTKVVHFLALEAHESAKIELLGIG